VDVNKWRVYARTNIGKYGSRENVKFQHFKKYIY
jgi:hypothetical protein